MIYYVRYFPNEDGRHYNLFEIEYLLKESEENKGKYYSEIHSFPCVKGLTYFLKDKFTESSFDYDMFIDYAQQIEDFRCLLYEGFTVDNSPKDLKDAEEVYYGGFRTILEDILHEFAEKYELAVIGD